MGQALPFVQEEEALQSLHRLASLLSKASAGAKQRQDGLQNPLLLAAEINKVKSMQASIRQDRISESITVDGLLPNEALAKPSGHEEWKKVGI